MILYKLIRRRLTIVWGIRFNQTLWCCNRYRLVAIIADTDVRYNSITKELSVYWYTIISLIRDVLPLLSMSVDYIYLSLEFCAAVVKREKEMIKSPYYWTVDRLEF